MLEALAHGEAWAGVFVPEAQAVLNQEAFVVSGEFVVQTGACNVGELHLHLPGCGGGTAALRNIPHATAGGLDHLVMGAAAFFNEAVTEDNGRVIDCFGYNVAAEVFVTAVG